MTTILFICVHNAGRSQMGEAFVNALARDDIRATSAGVSPGHGLVFLVIEVMEEIGILLTDHHPKQLDEEMMRAADIIIVMCGEACVAIPQDIEHTKRVEYWDVPDPVGSRDYVRKIRDDIKKRVEKLVSTL